MKTFFTIQMGKWRVPKALGYRFVDTTVKSGELLFAPTWDLLGRYKSGEIGNHGYTLEYYSLINTRLKNSRNAFESLFVPDTPVALACFCGARSFCHRRLLASVLVDECDGQYEGELISEEEVVQFEHDQFLSYSQWKEDYLNK